jgi:hypothetical protein
MTHPKDTDPMRDALEAIAGWRTVNTAGEYEGTLRDIIRCMADRAHAALTAQQAAPVNTDPMREAFRYELKNMTGVTYAFIYDKNNDLMVVVDPETWPLVWNVEEAAKLIVDGLNK